MAAWINVENGPPLTVGAVRKALRGRKANEAIRLLMFDAPDDLNVSVRIDHIGDSKHIGAEGHPVFGVSILEPDLFECQNCGKEWAENELHELLDVTERVAPGELMPAGECPDCGAVCHAS